MNAPKPRRRRMRRIGLGVVVGLLIWLGLISWQAWQFRRHTSRLQQLLQQPTQTSGNMLCDTAQASSNALRRLRFLVLPVSPVLRHVGWIPGIGPALQTTPALTDSGAATAELVDVACPTLVHFWPALQAPPAERLSLLLQTATEHPPDWAGLDAALVRLDAAWQGVQPANLEHWPFDKLPALQQVRPVVNDLREIVRLGREFWPVLGLLSGHEQPLRLLVAIHNPAELRPTGGFIGSTAILSVTNGKLEVAEFYNTGDLAAVAPAGSKIPKPYNDYLRASIWTFRDANWSPEWPRSANLLEIFWELNSLQPVDGVLALNSYVFQAMLEELGGVEVPNYGTVTSLDTLFEQYEGPLSGDKAFLGALLQAMIERIKTVTPRQTIALGAALARNFDQHQLSLVLHDQAAQEILAELGWDGSVVPESQQHLQIIDADLSYSDVQPFIEQQITHVTQLDAQGHALTNTVWLTYTNRYDDWSASSTAQQIYGLCFNPTTQLQERIPGCYGDYLRVYLPASAQLLDVAGADVPATLERDAMRSNVGLYLVVMPGETRTIQIDYVNVVKIAPPYSLEVLKQAGTNARPVSIIINDVQNRSTSLQSDLWYDRTFTIATTPNGPQITSGNPQPLNPSTTAEAFRRQPDFWQGWQLWEDGEQAAALNHWQATETLDLAIGQAWASFWRGDVEQAQALLNAIDPHATNEQTLRIEVLLAQIERYQGNREEARDRYQAIIKQYPDADAARIALALLLHELGNTETALEHLRHFEAPSIALHRYALDQSLQHDYRGADQTLALVLALNPSDTLAWERRYWLNRHASTPPNWEATIAVLDAATERFNEQSIWFERRAEAHQQQQNTPAAIADWQRTVALSPTHALAWYSLGIQQQSSDSAAAIAALEHALELGFPDRVTAYIVLGSLHLERGERDAAREAYQHALELAPDRTDVQEVLHNLGG